MLRKRSEKYILDEINDSKQIDIEDLKDIINNLYNDLKLTEIQLEKVLQTVNEAVTIIDKKDQVVGWSKRAEEMYQIKPTEIIGKNIKDFFSSLVITEVLNQGKVKDSYHQPCRGKHVLINASPIVLEKEIIGSVCAERDITETVYLHNELSKANLQVQNLEKKINKNNLQSDSFAKIHGQSKKMKSIIKLAKKVAITDVPIFINGETGTEQEVFAEAIHQESKRNNKPYVIINCGAIPNSLIESELFGSEKGAMIGFKQKGKLGKFELAQHGTIFLDEVDNLTLEMQVKLLRALQTKKIYHLGSEEPLNVDIRIIAGSNKNLGELIKKGLFREDLYYQLNVVTLEIPSLRERKDDIPELVYLLMQEFAKHHGIDIKKIEHSLMQTFLDYSWPGNIRELKNVMERLVILAEDDVLSKENLPESFFKKNDNKSLDEIFNLNEVKSHTEKQLILDTLKEAGGNKSKAAKLLGIPRSTLYYKMKNLNL